MVLGPLGCEPSTLPLRNGEICTKMDVLDLNINSTSYVYVEYYVFRKKDSKPMHSDYAFTVTLFVCYKHNFSAGNVLLEATVIVDF
jgi:hypothetical protein